MPASLAHASGAASTRQVPLLVVAAAAVVRLTYLAGAHPPFTAYYWQAATGMLREGSLAVDGVTTSALEPVYPAFVAAARLLVGDRPMLVAAVQAVVASAGAYYLYRLCAVLTSDRRVAVTASMLYAFYPLLVHHAIDGTESGVLTTVLIALAYHVVKIGTAADAAAAGAWLGAAVLTRATLLPMLVLTPVVVALRCRDHARASLCGIVALAAVTPFAVRNEIISHGLMPTRIGVNLLLSNNPYAPGVVSEYGADVLMPYARARLAAAGLDDLKPTPVNERKIDRAMARMAVDDIRQHTGSIAELKLMNAFEFFSPQLVPHLVVTPAASIRLMSDGASVVDGAATRSLASRLAYSLSYVPVVCFAIAGLYWRRHRLGADAVLWCLLLTVAAAHILFFPATRYRAPVEFVLLFYAAVGIVRLFRS